MYEPIRTAMIIQAYHPRIGGAERQLASLAPLLMAQGVEVHILTRRYPGLARFELVHGVPVHRLPVPGPKPVASLAFTLAALSLLRRLKPDIVHAHGLLSPGTTAVAARRMLGMPIAVTVHCRGSQGELERLRHKTFGARRIELIRRFVDAFVIISGDIDRELAEIAVPAERRIPIPNGVDTERFAPLSPAQKLELRARLGLPAGPTAVFTGRLVAEKCIDQLVAVWPEVRAAHPEAALVLVGSGPQEQQLRASAGAGVRLIGSVEDVSPYVQAADLFVLPSASEGLSVALLEAMSAGLAPIVTAVGGNLELIQDGLNGRLVAPGDQAALRDTLVALLGDRPQRERLGQAGRELVLREYQLPVAAARLRALYERLLGSRV